jgi:alpha-L-glutamate ligase-like protein
VFSFGLTIDVRADNEEVRIESFLPLSLPLQVLINEVQQMDGLTAEEVISDEGRKIEWQGVLGQARIDYRADLIMAAQKFDLGNLTPLSEEERTLFSDYLKPTEHIQYRHPEIIALWKQLGTGKTGPEEVLREIFNFTYQGLEPVPFKGLTDALTALRLGKASCNGKSRLFVALARLNQLPARLVGGVVMDGRTKKTSHQWVEVYLGGHWVPFDPTNGYFAELPAHYLRLYTGDHALFVRSSDIIFDYRFSSSTRWVARSIYAEELSTFFSSENFTTGVNLAAVLSGLGMREKNIVLFLLFPVATLLISFLRNIVGFRTFGVFLPMLIAAACLFTGLWQGLVSFIAILLLSFVSFTLLKPLRLLKVARLAAVITIVTIVFIVMAIWFKEYSHVEFALISLFPIVIISFAAERIHRLTAEQDWRTLLLTSAGTLLAIVSCYFIFENYLLVGLFSYFPELYFLVLVAQLYVGRWSGLRLSELIRFRGLLKKKDAVLGINARNIHLVEALNDRKLLLLAADKLQTKSRLKIEGVPVPETLYRVDNLSQLAFIDRFICGQQQFALKPNNGAQGEGILIVVDKQGNQWKKSDGTIISLLDIKSHCADILNGQYSQTDDRDSAFFEPLLIQPDWLQKIAPYGLSDIRVILIKGRPVAAMLRLPTKQSSGKANLHQGAIGVAIHIESGKSYHASQKGLSVTHHPDSNAPLLEIQIPMWPTILKICTRAFQAVPLGFMGVDICVERELGPLVLEVNGRPGIEIQNVRDAGLYVEVFAQ